MRRVSARIVGLCLLIMALAAPALGGPILISQPAYVGMQFYAYRPHAIPAGWLATYDGYPVFKAANGVWMYGAVSGRSIVPTSYVVGAVVPSVVGLVPWTTASVAPVVATTPVAPVATTAVYTSAPVVHTAVAPAPAVYAPAWTASAPVVAVGQWAQPVTRVVVPAQYAAWGYPYAQPVMIRTGLLY